MAAKKQKNFQPVNPSKKGTFTKSAKKAGMSVQAYAKSVMANPKATTLQKKRAVFVINSSKWNKGKKK